MCAGWASLIKCLFYITGAHRLTVLVSKRRATDWATGNCHGVLQYHFGGHAIITYVLYIHIRTLHRLHVCKYTIYTHTYTYIWHCTVPRQSVRESARTPVRPLVDIVGIKFALAARVLRADDAKMYSLKCRLLNAAVVMHRICTHAVGGLYYYCIFSATKFKESRDRTWRTTAESCARPAADAKFAGAISEAQSFAAHTRVGGNRNPY